MRSLTRSKFTVAVLFATGTAAAVTPTVARADTEIDIPFEKFVLDNGLTLIVHEDHKAPIVAVNVWYHVGSKNEKPGKTGFAHLFEHLMFNGSEHYNDDYFKVLEPLGGTDLNGTTNQDRTNYFQNVPTSALDTVLWMESDRMGHLLGAIDQARLDEQRGVVQNEKRQGENQPYGRVFQTITKNIFPAAHPYSWPVIGSMEDLDAASLDDVHEWFKTYYGAGNAVIAVAGDVDAKTAKEKVERYFGHIPGGPPLTVQEAWIAKRTGTHRQTMQDRVPQARVYKVWNVPQWGTQELTRLDLVSDVLARGKTSRLYKRLVYDDQIATDVSAFVFPGEIASAFMVQASARPDADLAAVEKAIDEELTRFLREGLTGKELRRVKTQHRASFIRGIERIGGFGGKSDVLAMNQVYGGSPDYYKKTLQWVADATAEGLLDTARHWLSDGQYVLEVHPFAKHTTVETDVDRAKVPEAGPAPTAKFPKMQHTRLANGLKVVLAERHAVPVVNFRLLVDAGYAADQGGIPGLGSLAMSMLDEGTKRRSALEISEELAMLGSTLSTGSTLDTSTVSLSTLKDNLDASLDIFADVILNPSFPEQDFQRLQRQRLARIQQEKARPFTMALRVLPRLIYGEGHAYANPLTGSGTEESVQRITLEDLSKYHQTWVKPGNATMIVVGDASMGEIKPLLEKHFASWKKGDVPTKNLATVSHRDDSTIYILDRPGALQSVLFAGHIAPPKRNPDEIAIETMNTILGGDFTARINMNLREDKHWSYGATSLFVDARGQRPFIAVAPVQTDKTKESMQELLKELSDILGTRPATADELARAKNSLTLTLPGSWETANAVARSIGEIVNFGLAEDYFETYPGKVRALTREQVQQAAMKTIHPDKMVWAVVGDREKIEAGIRELGLGTIKFIDADGNVIE